MMLTKEQSQFICGLPTSVHVNYIADMVSGNPAITSSTFYFGMDPRMREVDPVEVFDLVQQMIRVAYMEIRLKAQDDADGFYVTEGEQ